MTEVSLTPDGTRALREAENFCWRANVAILAPEHLLCGALIVMRGLGIEGLPSLDALHATLERVVATGSAALTDNVMWGSSAREALNATAGKLRGSGETALGARVIALGVIESGELNPMFFTELGTPKEALLNSLGAPQPS